MNLCVTVEGSPRVNALPSSSSSTWPEMSNKSNPVSLFPHLICMYVCVYVCMYACMYACMYVFMHVCIVYVCMYYVWMCVCMHVCICMYSWNGNITGPERSPACLPVTTSRGIPQAQGTIDPYEYRRNAADNGDYMAAILTNTGVRANVRVVSIRTCYGLGVLGFEPRCGRCLAFITNPF